MTSKIKNKFSMLVAALLLAAPLNAQLRDIRAVGEGSLSADDTSSRVQSKGPTAVILLNVTTLTLADADDEVDFYIQTTYDGGLNWTDVQNVHFKNADDGTTRKIPISIDGAKDGPGSDLSIAGTDPAANAEISETVPANTIWRVKSISASLVTDGNAAARVVRATLDDGSSVYYQASTRIDHTASLTVRYSWSPEGAGAVSTAETDAELVAALDATINVSLPDPTILSAGDRFITITGAMEAGDDWSAPQLSVEAWHDDSISTAATMGDNLKSYNRPLGSEVRIAVKVTGATAPTYNYSARILFLKK